MIDFWLQDRSIIDTKLTKKREDGKKRNKAIFEGTEWKTESGLLMYLKQSELNIDT